MTAHLHGSVGSNNRKVFTTFVGCTVRGVLLSALPIGRKDLNAGTKTLVFECGWGLTIGSNGSHWTEQPEEIRRAIQIVSKELAGTQAALEGILELAGEVPA